jgi:alkyl hydroperoxide reductase subunit AhpC
MNKFLSFLIFCCAFAFNMLGQGYELKVKISEYTENKLSLGYYYGEKQYFKDTMPKKVGDYWIFKGDKPLDPGMYIVITSPANSYFQILVDKGDQNFTMETSMANMGRDLKFKGSPNNQIFIDYLKFLEKTRKEADSINVLIKDAPEPKKAQLKAVIESMGEKVLSYQKNAVQKHKGTLAAAIIKSAIDIEVPKYILDMEKVNKDQFELTRWQYVKRRFFDNIDMADDRMLRGPIEFGKVDSYVNKVTVQHPDSINNSIDEVLRLVKPNEEVYKYYLAHFLNTYAKSNVIGMDAVYCHVALNYYDKGEAKWIDSTTLAKIVKDAKTLDPILIGKKAPNIPFYKEDNTPMTLHGVKSPYKVLIFWATDCGHCQKEMPSVDTFYRNFKSQGVEIIAICTKQSETDIKGCWDFIKDKKMTPWINGVDPYARFYNTYDVKSTPQVFILDENNTILYKKISPAKLGLVMPEIIETEERLKKEKLENASKGK